MKLNNKGQSLVTFVLLIPIFILILVLVVDIGNIVNLKLDLNNINKIIISYGIDNIDSINKEELEDLVKANDSKITVKTITIDKEKKQLEIILSKYSDSLLGKIVGIDGYNITSNYQAKINNEKKEIKKVS